MVLYSSGSFAKSSEEGLVFLLPEDHSGPFFEVQWFFAMLGGCEDLERGAAQDRLRLLLPFVHQPGFVHPKLHVQQLIRLQDSQLDEELFSPVLICVCMCVCMYVYVCVCLYLLFSEFVLLSSQLVVSTLLLRSLGCGMGGLALIKRVHHDPYQTLTV